MTMLSSKKHHFLIAVAVVLIAGMIGCGLTPALDPDSDPTPPVQYNLTVSSATGGSVTTPGEGTFTRDAGTVVDLVAAPDTDYRFVEWTGDVDTIDNANAAITTITINGDYSITANFEEIPKYDLAVDSTEGGEITTPGEGIFSYYEGTVVDLVATPNTGYHFVQWTGNVSAIADVYAAETTVTMDDDYSITANFAPFNGGNGTAEDPYRLTNWHHLDMTRYHLNAHFILMNDLDSNSAGYTELASETANDGNGWQPIGTTAENDKFTGSFDGQEHEICDLFIDRPDESRVGLFGVIGEEGTIKNVGAVNGSITGEECVGGLVGKNEGAVSNSYSTDSVFGDGNVGGLVGKNEGAISNSYSTGNLTGTSNVGGLIGKNEGTVSNSYSTGSVAGTSNIGGLVGKNEDTVSNSFWDTQTSGQTTSDGGTGKTTAQMKDIATFTDAGWDIIAVSPDETDDNYIWNIVNGETYPFHS